jgi:hypothetical protein
MALCTPPIVFNVGQIPSLSYTFPA